MSTRQPSNPGSISRDAMARVKHQARAADLVGAGVRTGLEVRDSGRGLLHLVETATGRVVGTGTNAAVLGRTRDFFA